jgi:hypothetical protein
VFNFDQDFGVFIGTVANDLFRLNVSLLDGDDVLAGDAVPEIQYVDFAEFCTEVRVENGLTATGTSIDLGSKTGTIVLARQDADPLDGYFVKVSSPIKLVLKHYPSSTDTDWFYGYIKSIERDTDADGISRVVLQIGDQIEQLMNTIATISVVADQTFEDRWAEIDAAAFALPVNSSRTAGGFTFPGIDIFEMPLAETITETMFGELGWLITTRKNIIAPMSHTYLTNTLAGVHKYEIHQDVTDAHIPPTYINQASSSDAIISTINATLTWDTGTSITVTDVDQAELYGNSTLETSVNLADETNLTNWANYALTLTGQQNIKALTVDAVDHRNSQLHNVYEMDPAECVLVNVQASGININEKYLISKVIHNITPNSWLTDLELWRN